MPVNLQIIPSDWLNRSNDFGARLMRAQRDHTPVLDHPNAAAWQDGSEPKPSDLFAKLLAHADFGEHLAAKIRSVMSGRERTPLISALQCHAAIPYQPTAVQAVMLLTALLCRAVDCDGERGISIDVLRQLGPEGVELVPMLHQVLASDLRASGAQIAEALEHVNLVSYSDEARIAAALAPRVAAPAQVVAAPLPPRSAVATASVVALAKQADKALPLSHMLRTLSFGAGTALTIARTGAVAAYLTRFGAKDDDASIAAAIVKALSSTQSAAGTWQGFLSATGPEGAALVDSLIEAQSLGSPVRPNYPFVAQVVSELQKTMPQDACRTLVKGLLQKSGLIPSSVPAVDRVLSEVPANHFVGKGLVAVQHLFPTTVSVIEACIKRGMAAKDIFILGTPYATNPLVVAYLRVLGVNVMMPTDALGNSREFEEHRVRELNQFLDRVAVQRAPAQGYLVLDDGGMLATTLSGHKPISQASAASFAKIFPPGRTVAIEQTTRGITELNKQPLHFSTIPVASAPAKGEEGTVIGWSLARTLIADLRQRGIIEQNKRIGMISAGTVGLATARFLRDAGFSVKVTDLDAKKLETARASGLGTADSLEALLPESDVILACTGKASIAPAALGQWPGVLASGSSAAIEFDVPLLDSARRTPSEVINLARPLNFKGDGYEDLSAAQIGVTRGLIFAALVQGTTMSAQKIDRAEWSPLDARLDRAVSTFWNQNGGTVMAPLAAKAQPQSGCKRPDTLGALARHDEWMSYLSSLERPLCPSPFETRFAPGLYFFADDEGRVRSIDTREPAASQLSDLSAVPKRVLPADEKGALWIIEYQNHEGRFVRGWPSSDSPPERVDGLVAIKRQSNHGSVPLWGTSYVWTSGKDLVVSFTRSPNTHRIEANIAKGDLVRRIESDTYAVITPSPPSVRMVCLHGDESIWTRAMRDYRVPTEFARIESFVDDPSTGQKAIVGRSAQGELLVAMYAEGAAGRQITRLPANAIFRGFHRAERSFDIFVDYTLKGEPVELENMRSMRMNQYVDGGGFNLFPSHS